MPFRRVEDEVQACVFNKLQNRKVRRLLYEENLLNRKREKEIESKKIPNDRRLERFQITMRLQKRLASRSNKAENLN